LDVASLSLCFTDFITNVNKGANVISQLQQTRVWSNYQPEESHAAEGRGVVVGGSDSSTQGVQQNDCKWANL
jgi:hypothetical protein